MTSLERLDFDKDNDKAGGENKQVVEKVSKSKEEMTTRNYLETTRQAVN